MLGWYLASGGISSSSSLLSSLNTADTGLDAFLVGGALFPMFILMPKFLVLFSGSSLFEGGGAGGGLGEGEGEDLLRGGGAGGLGARARPSGGGGRRPRGGGGTRPRGGGRGRGLVRAGDGA